MSDYTSYKSWKSSHASEMQDLTFARPDDIFIFTRFTSQEPDFEGKQVLYASDIKEAAGYFQHVFLYDILNDMTDDLALDPKLLNNENQKDVLTIMLFWFKLGKAFKSENFEKLFREFCKDFNATFNHRNGAEYEFQILNGADELREFLISSFKNYPNFDQQRLENLCSSDLFAGRPLYDFLNDFFN